MEWFAKVLYLLNGRSETQAPGVEAWKHCLLTTTPHGLKQGPDNSIKTEMEMDNKPEDRSRAVIPTVMTQSK